MKDLSEKLAAKDIEGRGLSKNDFTDSLKHRLDVGVRPHTGYKFLQDLLNARRSLNVIIAGDSTSTITGASGVAKKGWTYQFFEKLAPYFPNRTFSYRPQWSATTGAYGGTETIQTGTGSFSCTIYNTGIGGTIPTYPWGSQFVGNAYFNSASLSTGSCDLIIWCYGFNMNNTAPRNIWSALSQSVASLSQLMALHPKAGVMIMEQWPIYGTPNGDQNTRACRELADILNATLIETEARILLDGKPKEYYYRASSDPEALPTVGEVHLSALGYDIVSTLAIEQLLNSNAQKSTNTSTLLMQSQNLIPNGNFDTFSGGALSGFTSNNVTLAENTTDYLTGNRSIFGTIGTNAASYIETQIGGLSFLKKISRKSFTVSADIRLPLTGNNNRLCVIYISYDGVESYGQVSYSGASNVADIGGYGWTKKALTFNMPNITNFSLPVIVRFYFQESAGSPSGAGLIVGIDNLKLDIGERPFI